MAIWAHRVSLFDKLAVFSSTCRVGATLDSSDVALNIMGGYSEQHRPLMMPSSRPFRNAARISIEALPPLASAIFLVLS